MALDTAIPNQGCPNQGWVREDRDRHRFKVARRAFTDEAVLEAERRVVFEHCWIYLGHESEIPNPNDFVTRSVAGRELIFNRDRRGAVHAFMNVCPHRGATVVREKKGNALGFQCFYHGWAFSNAGAFATRIADGNYPEDFGKDHCEDLTAAPRLEDYRGLYFINFDRDAGSLADYLAGAKAYIDVIMDHGAAAGMEIIGGTQEYSIRANWKLLVENSVDGYHAATTHATYFDYLGDTVGSMTKPPEGIGRGKALDLGNGHAVIEYWAPWGRPIAQWIPAWGEAAKVELDGVFADLKARFGEARATQIAKLNHNLVIFPNLVINDVMAITVRTFYPQEPDFMRVNAWALGVKDESASLRKWRLFNFLEFLGPGGFATPDDVEALESCQRGYRNRAEAGWNDLSKGMMRNEPATDDEEQMRCFWREWDRRVGASLETV
jgi:p-cumate 2,3-dioxygenase subunit alpha